MTEFDSENGPPPAITLRERRGTSPQPTTTSKVFGVIVGLAGAFLVLQAVGAALEYSGELAITKPLLGLFFFGTSGISWLVAGTGFWKARGYRWVSFLLPLVFYLLVYWVIQVSR